MGNAQNGEFGAGDAVTACHDSSPNAARHETKATDDEPEERDRPGADESCDDEALADHRKNSLNELLTEMDALLAGILPKENDAPKENDDVPVLVEEIEVGPCEFKKGEERRRSWRERWRWSRKLDSAEVTPEQSGTESTEASTKTNWIRKLRRKKNKSMESNRCVSDASAEWPGTGQVAVTEMGDRRVSDGVIGLGSPSLNDAAPSVAAPEDHDVPNTSTPEPETHDALPGSSDDVNVVPPSPIVTPSDSGARTPVSNGFDGAAVDVSTGLTWGNFLGEVATTMLSKMASGGFSLLRSAVDHFSNSIDEREWNDDDDEDDESGTVTASDSAASTVDGPDSPERNSPVAEEMTESLQRNDETRNKLRMIRQEFLETEEVYVERLAILVHARDKAERICGAENAKKMFPGIETIYEFHRQNFLPELRKILEHQLGDSSTSLGHVLKQLAPFLKLYTSYVTDLEKSMERVDAWQRKSASLAEAIRQLEENSAPRHRSLRLQDHMLEPVQRVPRYELLIKNYLRRLPAGHPDSIPLQEALRSVSDASQLFEERMNRNSRLSGILLLQRAVESLPLFNSSHVLLKDGPIGLVLRHSNVPGHLFLISGTPSTLMLCKKKKIVVSSCKYKAKRAINLTNSLLLEGTNLNNEHSFTVSIIENDVFREEFTFSAKNAEDCRMWIDSISAEIRQLQGEDGKGHLGQIDANETVIQQGWMLISSDGGTTWRRRFLTLQEPGKLAAYNSQKRKTCCTMWLTLPLFSFKLVPAPEGRKNQAIRLDGPVGSRVYHLLDDINPGALHSWADLISKFTLTS